MPDGFSYTTTAQQIVNSVSQDLRSQLGTSGADANILLDYLDRVQKEVLRRSRWPYTLSDIQYFITELEQTNYWIGQSGSGPAGAVDTGLNLTNLFCISRDSVFDLSNFKQLQQTLNMPVSTWTNYRTGQSRPNRPAVFRSDPINPALLQVYPAPDNQNTTAPVPSSPIVATTTTGGALANRIYYIGCTFLDDDGNEGVASDFYTKVFVPAGQLATVLSPKLPFTGTASGAIYTKYNVYYSTEPQTVGTLQNNSPIALGTSWTEPTSGMTGTGPNPPTSSSLIPLDGYLISFRYFQTRPSEPSLGSTLSIPDDYSDVVKAGVNAYAFQLAERPEDVQVWKAMFEQGIVQIIADKNLFPRGNDFVKPDPASVGGQDFTSQGLFNLFNI